MDKKTMEKHDEIMYESLDRISQMYIESDEATAAISNVAKLNEIMVKDREWKTRDQQRLDQQALQDEEFEYKKTSDSKAAEKAEKADKEERKFKILDRIISIVGIVLPMFFYSKMTTRFMIYDKNGNIPTFSLFRNFINKLHFRK